MNKGSIIVLTLWCVLTIVVAFIDIKALSTIGLIYMFINIAVVLSTAISAFNAIRAHRKIKKIDQFLKED